MLHVRYDWRRRVAWLVLSLCLFLTSHTTINSTSTITENDLVINDKTTGKVDLQVVNDNVVSSMYFEYYLNR